MWLARVGLLVLGVSGVAGCGPPPPPPKLLAPGYYRWKGTPSEDLGDGRTAFLIEGRWYVFDARIGVWTKGLPVRPEFLPSPAFPPRHPWRHRQERDL